VTETFSGSYPIESRGGEIERLHIQGAAMAPDTDRMLELIGVREGWSCIDIGCGPGGITELLSRRVGSTGRVVGLDMNAGFLNHARATAPSNVEFVLADAYGSNLPAGTFDLVHMRFVASTSGRRSGYCKRPNVSRDGEARSLYKKPISQPSTATRHIQVGIN
jgi:SAM-dependent methyltransferase